MSMKKSSNDKNDARWLWLYFFAIIIFAGTVNLAMYLPIPTLETLDAKSWLGFWGGYLGGALGCIPALAALIENRRQAKQQYEEIQTERRLQVLPVFNCRVFSASYKYIKNLNTSRYFVLDSGFVLRLPEYDEFPEKENFDNTNYIELCNCGLGPALEAKLTCNGTPVDLFLFKADETNYYLLDPSWKLLHHNKSTTSPYTMTFSLEYLDVFGNKYTQTNTFSCHINHDINGPNLSFDAPTVGSPVLSKAPQTK